MRPKDRPEIVLAEVTMGDERGARVPSERRELAGESNGRVAIEVASRREKGDERLVGRARGGRHDVAFTKHDAAHDVGRREREQAPRRATRDRAREGPKCVAFGEHGRDLEAAGLSFARHERAARTRHRARASLLEGGGSASGTSTAQRLGSGEI